MGSKRKELRSDLKKGVEQRSVTLVDGCYNE